MEFISYKDMAKKYARKGNKYFAKKSVYKGRVYHSKKEAVDAMWLDSLLAEGKIKEILKQVNHRVFVNGKKICELIVDFMVILNDGRSKYVETKGFQTREWKIKRNAIMATSPIPYLVNPSEKELLA